MYILIYICVLSLAQCAPLSNINEEVQINDTTIVGKVIEVDSIFQNSNFQYQGIQYFYGVHHFKIAVIDISDSGKVTDTLILAYVYNKLTESESYKKNFGLNIGEQYIFYIHPFTPCKSDFPRIQGFCSDDGFNFYPESNKLINRYHSINRIIFSIKYRG